MATSIAGSGIDLGKLIDETPVSRFQIGVIALCALGAFLDGYDIQAIGLAAPSLSNDLDIPAASLGPAFASALVGMAIGSVALGPLADRFGRRPMMIALMLLIGTTSLGTATAVNIWELVSWRFLTGLGLGALVPVATSLTAEYAPRHRRTALITLMVCCISLGSLTSSILAPAIDSHFGWRGIFVVGGVLPIVMALIYWVFLPESLRRLVERNPADPRIALQLGRIVGGQIADIRVAAQPATGRSSFAQLYSRTYMPRTLLLWAIWSLNLFVNFSLANWLPTLLKSSGWNHADALRAVALMAIGGLMGGILLSWLADKARIVAPLITAYLVASAALIGFTLLPSSYWGYLIVIAGFGAFGAQLTIGALAAAFYPFEIRATGLGWASGVGRLGSIVGPLALGVMLGRGLGPATVLTILTVPMFICAACVTLLPRFLEAARQQQS